jgi:hypothetical protein
VKQTQNLNSGSCMHSSYLYLTNSKLVETSPNHLCGFLQHFDTLWTKCTVACPSTLSFSAWEEVEKETHASIFFYSTLNYCAAASPSVPSRPGQPLRPSLILPPSLLSNQSPPLDPTSPKPTYPSPLGL